MSCLIDCDVFTLAMVSRYLPMIIKVMIIVEVSKNKYGGNILEIEGLKKLVLITVRKTLYPYATLVPIIIRLFMLGANAIKLRMPDV